MIEERLLAFLSNFLGNDCKNAKDANEAMLTLDSLDKMDLVYRLEENFSISLDDKCVIKEFSDLVNFVEQGLDKSGDVRGKVTV